MSIRNLWAEVSAANAEKQRRLIETLARVLYGFFIVVGGLVALDLYTRPNSLALKLFGVAVSLGLVLSDILWAWATHHSAAGLQRWVARVFWGLSLLIYALNVISDYLHYLDQPLGALENWYYIGSMSTVVIAATGLAFYLMLSPDQRIHDVRAKAHLHAVDAALHGLDSPDAETLEAFNRPLIGAVRSLAEQAAKTVAGTVIASRNGSMGKDSDPND